MKGKSDMSDNENHINRRDFIVTGSLVVAGLTVPAIASAAAKPKTATLPLSVGFMGDTQTSFQAADKVLSGDPALFSLGARFSFRGMQRSTTDALSVFIDVIYRTYDGADAPFCAFTHAEDQSRVSNSSPSGFLVPVPAQGTIDLTVKARRAALPEATTVVSFAVNTARNALKLNQGTYLFALTDRAVDWTSVRLDNVNFDCVVMTVGAGSAVSG